MQLFGYRENSASVSGAFGSHTGRGVFSSNTAGRRAVIWMTKRDTNGNALPVRIRVVRPALWRAGAQHSGLQVAAKSTIEVGNVRHSSARATGKSEAILLGLSVVTGHREVVSGNRCQALLWAEGHVEWQDGTDEGSGKHEPRVIPFTWQKQ
jgi:hypothetical protein